MPKVGEKDTDSRALEARIALQRSFGAFDLGPWILERLDLEPGLACLDLGCGRGAQSLPIARAVGPGGRVTALDVCADSLAELRRRAEAEELAPRIATVEAALDDVAAALGDARFQRVLGSYSLYYADDPETLFVELYERLSPGGVLFFCGPAYGNNLELRALVAEVTGVQATEQGDAPPRFMEREAPEIVRRLFGNADIARFENPVTYPAPEALIEYWRNHNLFDPGADTAFREAARKRFEESGPFVNKKRGLGVRAVKRA